MKKKSISTGFVVLVGILLAMMTAIGLNGIRVVNIESNMLHSIYKERMVPIDILKEISINNLQARIAIANGVISPSTSASHADEAEKLMAENGELWRRYTEHALDAEEKSLADEVSKSRSELREKGLEPAVRALKRQEIDAVKTIQAEQIRGALSSIRSCA